MASKAELEDKIKELRGKISGLEERASLADETKTVLQNRVLELEQKILDSEKVEKQSGDNFVMVDGKRHEVEAVLSAKDLFEDIKRRLVMEHVTCVVLKG